MSLSRFGVKNYKCLADIDIPLTPIHVLIGQNDAGKTSLLEAMAAFYGSGDVALADAFPYSEGGQRKLVFSGSGEETIELRGEWSASLDEDASTSHGFVARFPASDQMTCFLDYECYSVGEKNIRRQIEGNRRTFKDIPQQTLVCDYRQNRSVQH